MNWKTTQCSMFLGPESSQKRILLETALKDVLLHLVPSYKQSLFNPPSKKLNGISMVGIYALLMVLSFTILSLSSESCISAHKRTRILSELIAKTFWAPDAPIDGHATISYVPNTSHRSYDTKLLDLSIDYGKKTSRVYLLCLLARESPSKPNTHRLLQLYNTIPLFMYTPFSFLTCYLKQTVSH